MGQRMEQIPQPGLKLPKSIALKTLHLNRSQSLLLHLRSKPKPNESETLRKIRGEGGTP
jgi:hypothetical protein